MFTSFFHSEYRYLTSTHVLGISFSTFVSLHCSYFEMLPCKNECLIQVAARLRSRSGAAQMLGLRVRIPPAAWMSVCCKCCVLSGRGLCDGPVRGPENYCWICVSLSVIRCKITLTRLGRKVKLRKKEKLIK